MTERATETTPTTTPATTERGWQAPSLAGLKAIELQAMPAFEVLLLDDLAAYLMGAGSLEPPYTVEHGSRVISALFGAVINSALYSPEKTPPVSESMLAARERFVDGAHGLAQLGIKGVDKLVSRLIPAILGELETHKEAPEQQTGAVFYYCLLAVESGPLNLLDEGAATGTMELFAGWDQVLGDGLVLPWRTVNA
ncbi:MAG: hypothetical protein JWM76_4016 [Pseudonocardiales bacterium]|nr:hypothetical protein [Pseudonocardiales bacterium]